MYAFFEFNFQLFHILFNRLFQIFTNARNGLCIKRKEKQNNNNNEKGEKTQEKAKQVAFSYRNRPKSVNETAIWWVEYVAATRGAPLLKSQLKNLNIISYHSFDIYATILISLLVIVTVWYFMILKLLKKGNTQQQISDKVKKH